MSSFVFQDMNNYFVSCSKNSSCTFSPHHQPYRNSMSWRWSVFWSSWRACVKRRCNRPLRRRRAWASSTTRMWCATCVDHQKERTETRWSSVTSAMSAFIRLAIYRIYLCVDHVSFVAYAEEKPKSQRLKTWIQMTKSRAHHKKRFSCFQMWLSQNEKHRSY